MLHGVGTDLTELPRMARALQNARLQSKLFTAAELSLYKSRGFAVSVLAGNFAAKEAVVKAMGTGFAGFWPNEVEILRGSKGEPYVTLHGKARTLADKHGIAHFHISITNTAEYAMAFAVAERADIG